MLHSAFRQLRANGLTRRGVKVINSLNSPIAARQISIGSARLKERCQNGAVCYICLCHELFYQDIVLLNLVPGCMPDERFSPGLTNLHR